METILLNIGYLMLAAMVFAGVITVVHMFARLFPASVAVVAGWLAVILLYDPHHLLGLTRSLIIVVMGVASVLVVNGEDIKHIRENWMSVKKDWWFFPRPKNRAV